jgi:antitoxin HicB
MPDTLDFTVILEPQPEGGFTVRVPSLPEVVTEGDTEAEALAMAQEAIRLVLDHRRKHGIAISEDMPPTLRKVTIAA